MEPIEDMVRGRHGGKNIRQKQLSATQMLGRPTGPRRFHDWRIGINALRCLPNAGFIA